MNDERPPGLWTPGFANRKSRLVMSAGLLVAILGLATGERAALLAGIGTVAAGGLFDLHARVAGWKAVAVLTAVIVGGTVLMVNHPAEVWHLMGVFGAHANSLLGGK